MPIGHAQPGADQRATVVLGDIDADPDQDQGDHRQPDPQGVEQAERALRAGDVLGLEQHERLVDLRDPLGQGEPLGDQPLLDRLDERRQVERDGVALHGDRAATLAGQRLDQRLVRHPVGLDPGVLERLALDDPLDLGADKALHAVGDRAGQPLQRRGGLGGQPAALHAGAQRVHDLGGERLDVDVGEDLGGDLVGDGLLDRGIRGQRRDGGDIAVGVGDLVAGPHRHPCQRRQHAAQHDQHHGHQRAPPLPPRPPGVSRCSFTARDGRLPLLRAQGGDLGAQPFQLRSLVLPELRSLLHRRHPSCCSLTGAARSGLATASRLRASASTGFG